jgi:2-polyprenyl-6-methoxyphenol hydroxylase-like FAD-dependent oxidoreductase
VFERTNSAGHPFGSINYRRLSEIYGFKTIGIELKKLLAILEKKLLDTKNNTNAVPIHRNVTFVKLEGKSDENLKLVGEQGLYFELTYKKREAATEKLILSQYDFIVIADGVNSAFCKIVNPTPPVKAVPYGGRWNAIIPRPTSYSCGYAVEMWGNARRFGAFPVSNDRLYVWGTYQIPKSNTDVQRKSYVTPFINHFEGFGGHWNDIAKELKQKFYCFEDRIWDSRCYPLGKRVALVGEAAHTMPPFFNGQDIGQAVEDGAILANALISDSRTSHLQVAYGFARQQRIKKIQKLATKNAVIAHRHVSSRWRLVVRDWLLRWQFSTRSLTKMENFVLSIHYKI